MRSWLAVALLVGAVPAPQSVRNNPEPGLPSASSTRSPDTAAGAQGNGDGFTRTFGEDARDFASTGTNPYFVLEPGYTMVLEGKEDGKDARHTITVTTQTKTIDGVETRAVEEREEIGGKLHEVTRDYFAISKRTNNVYYFGEEVDEYEDGKVTGHEGTWLSGVKGARYGLMMMATPLLGARYYQELAPGVGMDRAEVVSLSETFECPAGKFMDVLKTEETTPLEPKEKEHKLYARGVGLLYDDGLKLVHYGKGDK